MRGLILGSFIVTAVSLFSLSLFVPRSPQFSSQTLTTPSSFVTPSYSTVAKQPGNGNASDIQSSKNDTLQNRAGSVAPIQSVESPDDYVTERTNRNLHSSAINGDKVPKLRSIASEV